MRLREAVFTPNLGVHCAYGLFLVQLFPLDLIFFFQIRCVACSLIASSEKEPGSKHRKYVEIWHNLQCLYSALTQVWLGTGLQGGII